MSQEPLQVAILWHMHQPDYRDRSTGRAVLPWVRLHAVKDYFTMAALVEEFPALRLTFNYVPALLSQLEDYLAGRFPDEHLVLSEAPAAQLDPEGQSYLLRNFFMAHPDTMVRRFPRYRQLLANRGSVADARDLEATRRSFTVADWRDLQVLFNLAWFSPYSLTADERLRELASKGQGFTEEDKALALEVQRETAAKVVPLLRRLLAEGRIEVSTTPFYHPILPLLVDTDVARVAMPDVTLPRTPFRHPEDAREQVRRAAAYHEEAFGARPQGIWPSEGSVSPAVLEILREEGFRWTATDENILLRSLGHPLGQEFYRTGKREELLYRPWKCEASGGGTALFFRDHVLSDLVGFSYSGWDPGHAVEDFVGRLRAIARSAPGSRPGAVVSVILDGENAWEYYPDGGLAFLRGLYGRLSADPELKTTTFGSYLDRHPVEASIPRIFAGSWINNDFAIWIGHREDLRAWELLAEARTALVAAETSGTVPPERLSEAWEELYTAEGSDWCWWYGDDHTSWNDEVFDELYRRHLLNLYALIGEPAPERLLVSIIEGAREAAPAAPAAASLITPRIDGRVSSYFEWLGATAYEVHRRGGTMHRTDVPITHVHFGIGMERLFLRVDFRLGLHDLSLLGDAFVVQVSKPRPCVVTIPAVSGTAAATVFDAPTQRTEELPAGSAALDEILEVAVPWSALGAAEGDAVQFQVGLLKSGETLATWPMTGTFCTVVPGPDFERMMWSV